LDKAAPFSQVQKEVSDLTKDRILVGHALSNDLEVSPIGVEFPPKHDPAILNPIFVIGLRFNCVAVGANVVPSTLVHS
jgi:hypothetical protein